MHRAVMGRTASESGVAAMLFMEAQLSGILSGGPALKAQKAVRRRCQLHSFDIFRSRVINDISRFDAG